MESIASTQDKWMNEWTNKWIGKNEWNVWASKGWELGGEEGRGGRVWMVGNEWTAIAWGRMEGWMVGFSTLL